MILKRYHRVRLLSSENGPDTGGGGIVCMKNILIINPFGIGDVLFTTPLVRALKEGIRPAPRVTFMCNARTYPILARNGHVDEIIVFDRGLYRNLWRKSKAQWIREFAALVSRVRKSGFDAAIDISLGRQYSFFLKLLGVPVRAGFDYKKRGIFLTHKVPVDSFSRKPVAEYYLDLARLLQVPPAGAHLEFPVTEKDEKEAAGFLRSRGVEIGQEFFCIVPGGGGSWGNDALYKRWHVAGFSYVADVLGTQYHLKPVIVGSPQESAVCEEVRRFMKIDGVVLAELSLGGCAALFRRAKLVVCNDGGPLHIAVSQGVKTVSVFGPVDEKVYGPFPPGADHIVVKSKIGCRPCYVNFRYNRCGHRTCLTAISAQEVVEAACSLLGKP